MTSPRCLSPIPALSALAALALLTGCSSAPLPPRAEAAPPSPSASAPAVIASATAAPVASAAPVAPPAEPEEKKSREDDDPTRGGTRLVLEDGAVLTIEARELSAPDSPPEVTLILSRGGKEVARREGFAAVTGVKPKLLAATHLCERSNAHLRRESFGSAAGVRVSIVCISGEDYARGTELAVLFRLDEPLRDLDALKRLWAGLADGMRSDMDSCLMSRTVAFQLINPRTLEKTTIEVRNWTDQVIGEPLKAQLKQKCKVGRTKRVERVALP